MAQMTKSEFQTALEKVTASFINDSRIEKAINGERPVIRHVDDLWQAAGENAGAFCEECTTEFIDMYADSIEGILSDAR